MPAYTEKVLDHFMNPRNVGEIPNADGIGQVGNPTCGDMMAFYVKVKDDRLEDVKFKTFGCGAAIAVSSMVSEMAMGKTLDEAKAITREQVAAELGGLPDNKMHCSNLGAEALHAAIENYEKKKELTLKHGECKCPFCDEFFKDIPEICTACGAKLRYCEECGELIPRGQQECPACTEKAEA